MATAAELRMQPLVVPDEVGGGYEGAQICTSQWGYNYLCTRTTPLVSTAMTSLPMATFITQHVQATFTIWNGGGGRLTGRVTVPAPCSILSGGSFSLLPGQPQEVVVQFSPTTSGSSTGSMRLASGSLVKEIPVTATVYTFEEYLRAVLDAHNTAIQDGGYGAI